MCKEKWRQRPEPLDENCTAQIRILIYKTEQYQDLRVIKDNVLAICTMSDSSKKINRVLPCLGMCYVSRSDMYKSEVKYSHIKQ